MGKTRQISGVILAIMALWLPLVAQAFTVRSGAEVTFDNNDGLTGTTYVAAERIVIDTPLPGDLICAGRKVTINQPIDGDVICAASDLTINAKVSGSIRSLGERVKVDNQVERNLMLFGSDVTLGEKTEVKGETMLAGEFLESQGQYLNHFLGAFGQAKLSGQYSAPIRFFASTNKPESLRVMAGAKLAQDLRYTAYEEIKIDDKAEIKGEVVRQDWPAKQANKKDAAVSLIWKTILQIFMLLFIGLIVISLWPQATKELLEKAEKQPVKIALKGLLILIVMPISAFILIFTVIGLPLALIVFIIWGLLLYLAKLVIGYWLGRKILPRVKNNIWPLIVGVSVLLILMKLPLIGWWLGAVATWWGTGLLWRSFRKTME